MCTLPVTYPELFWADWYTHQTHEGATKVGVPPDVLKTQFLALSVLRFLCKTFFQIT